MRIKELMLWCNGKKQKPKKYRTYEVGGKYRIGRFIVVLFYVVFGKRIKENKLTELCNFGGASSKTKKYKVRWKLKEEWTV